VPLPALLVIDVQRAFDEPGWAERNNPDAEKRISELLAAWRDTGAPLVHVRHQSDSSDGRFHRGTPGFEFKPEAEPLPGEPVVEKRTNSAFVNTGLEERLRADGAEQVVVAGLTTDHCCSTTARSASDLGFETWFRRRCHRHACPQRLRRRDDAPNSPRQPRRRVRSDHEHD